MMATSHCYLIVGLLVLTFSLKTDYLRKAKHRKIQKVVMECEIAVSGYRRGLSRIKDTGIIQIFI